MGTRQPAPPEHRITLATHEVTPARLAETLAALANAGGGSLLLAVEPPAEGAEPLPNLEATLDRVLNAAQATDPPLIIPLPQARQVEGRPALEVSVPRGLPHVYGVRGRYLVREGARNRPLPAAALRRLMAERGATSFEAEVPDGVSADDLDWVRVDRYAEGLGFGPLEREALLRRRGCLAGDLRPTVAGLLLFGREPQRWVHSSEILVARYAGAAMGDRYVKEEIRGALPDQIRQAEAFVVSNLRRSVQLRGLERVEEPDVPLPAVREAIVNAVAHRDYGVRGDEIRILMFSDRLEFYSPGRLPGHVTVDNLVDERYSRNESLVQVLSDMGFIERLGYGIDRMIRLMAEVGLPAPRFEERAAGFQVTLYGHGASALGMATDARRWYLLGLNSRQEQALEYLAERGRITNREFQELCPDVSPETIRRDLADLVAKELLLKIGDKRATYYIFK